MKKLPALLILSGLISAPVFAADAAPAAPNPFAGNIGVTTDYIFRGVTQSQHKPAVSGGLDYTHSSGLYAGTWLSNQSWVDAVPNGASSSLEMDLYGGYKGAVATDVGYDVGVIHYHYPHDSLAGITTPNTTEVYLGGSWKFVSLKYNYVVSDYFIGWGGVGGTGVSANKKTQGSGYLDLSVNYDLGGGWGAIAHAGHQSIKNYGVASYTDWKLGASKDLGFGTVTLAYTDTNAKLADAAAANAPVYVFNGKDVAQGRLALSFAKTF